MSALEQLSLADGLACDLPVEKPAGAMPYPIPPVPSERVMRIVPGPPDPAAEPADDRPLDARGYPRAASTMPEAGRGRVPKNKGRTYPPDPPTAAEILALFNAIPTDTHGTRLRALTVLLWRSGLRISEALDLRPSDLRRDDRAIVVRHGKGDRRRTSVMDEWGWKNLEPWLVAREAYPSGPIFCVILGATAGRRWNDSDVRRQLHRYARAAGLTKRIAPHQFRHALAVDLWREGHDVFAIQHQLGHVRLDVTQGYLRSIDPIEVLSGISGRAAPVVPMTTGTDRKAPRG